MDDVRDLRDALSKASARRVSVVGTAVSWDHEIPDDKLLRSSTLERRALVLRPGEPLDPDEVSNPHSTLGGGEWQVNINAFQPVVLHSQAMVQPYISKEAEILAQVAHVLEGMGRPFIQPLRLMQLGVGAVDALLVALWIATLMQTTPPLPLAMLGTVALVVVTVAVHRWIVERLRRLTLFAPTWVRWEMYDRPELAEKRAERSANFKSAAVGSAITLCITLLGVFVAAYLRGEI